MWVLEITFQGELDAAAWVRPWDGETELRVDKVKAIQFYGPGLGLRKV